jgi:hypothetical protein
MRRIADGAVGSTRPGQRVRWARWAQGLVCTTRLEEAMAFIFQA